MRTVYYAGLHPISSSHFSILLCAIECDQPIVVSKSRESNLWSANLHQGSQFHRAWSTRPFSLTSSFQCNFSSRFSVWQPHLYWPGGNFSFSSFFLFFLLSRWCQDTVLFPELQSITATELWLIKMSQDAQQRLKIGCIFIIFMFILAE